MNFYQRANLTFGLAVLLGFEFVVTKSMEASGQLNHNFNWEVMLWMFFQFVFRLKVTIDDHHSFGIKQSCPTIRFKDYFLFCSGNLFFVLAAVTSANMNVSSHFFESGLIVTTLWIMHHSSLAREHSNAISKSPYKEWIALNCFYTLFLCVIVYEEIFHSDNLSIKIFMFIILFTLLLVDFIVSKTIERMPEIT